MMMHDQFEVTERGTEKKCKNNTSAYTARSEATKMEANCSRGTDTRTFKWRHHINVAETRNMCNASVNLLSDA